MKGLLMVVALVLAATACAPEDDAVGDWNVNVLRADAVTLDGSDLQTALDALNPHSINGTFHSFPSGNGSTFLNDQGAFTDIVTVNATLPIAESDVTNLVADLAGKQATLVSGMNIKTVNGSSLLGAGDLSVGVTVGDDNATAATRYPVWANGNSLSTSTANLTYNPGTGVFSAAALNIDTHATVGHWLDFPGIANPAAPSAGTVRFHALTTQGFTRFEQDNEAPTNLTLGRDEVFIARNTSGSDIAKGKPVYVTGSTGNVANIALAKADADSTLPAVGVTLDAITNNSFGQVMKTGIISQINTSAYSSGDTLWVSPDSAGAFVNARPAYPDLVQRIATVLTSGVGNGSLLVVTAPFVGGMDSGTTAANFTALLFVGDLQGNASTTTKLATARLIAGESFDGSADITITTANVAPSTNRNYLTDSQLNDVQNLSGVNTGDQIVPSNEAGAANNFLTAYNSGTGAFSKAQPTWANIDKSTSSIADITTRSHTSLSDIGTNSHATIDTFIASKAAASGLASLDGSSLVVQNPVNATSTATASKIPIADGSGKLDTWVTTFAGSAVGLVPSSAGGTSNFLRADGNWAAPTAANAVGMSVGQVFVSKSFTNIGASYVDVYVTAFDSEDMMVIDFTGVTSVRAVFMWDYVGSGTQRVRWVDAADNNNVLLESATFTADRDATDTGWVALPAAFINATKTIEWQGKSTTAGDDPVAKGYVLYVK